MKLKLTGDTFEREVVHYEGMTLITFYAVWCGKCAMMEEIIEELAEKYGDAIKFATVDMEEAPLITAEYEIELVPTFVIFQNGEEVIRASGILSQSTLEEMIVQVL